MDPPGAGRGAGAGEGAGYGGRRTQVDTVVPVPGFDAEAQKAFPGAGIVPEVAQFARSSCE